MKSPERVYQVYPAIIHQVDPAIEYVQCQCVHSVPSKTLKFPINSFDRGQYRLLHVTVTFFHLLSAAAGWNEVTVN